MVRISKHSCVCMCMCRVVCCACVLKWLCVCVESVCGVCAEECVGCAFCVLCVWCIVVCVVMCCVGAGVGVQCVVRGVRGVCCVCGAAWHAENHPLCRFKTPPCVGSKRIRVYRQNARMLNTRAFCRYTRMRFEPTHGDVLNLHTGRWEGGRGGGGAGGFSSLSFSLPFSLSLFLRSLPTFSSSYLFLFSLPALVSLSPLSATMTMITRPVGLSLCTHGSDCQRVRVPVLWLIPCLAELVRII